MIARTLPVLTVFLMLLTARLYAGPVEDVQAHIDARDYDLALELVEQLLREDRKNELLLLQKGVALIKLEDYKKAITHYKKLIRRFRDNPEPSNNLGVVYRLQGDYNSALKQLRKTTSRFPDYAKAWENLGDTYILMAQREYEHGLEQIPDHALLTTKRDISKGFHSIALNNTRAATEQAVKGVSSASSTQSTGFPLEDEVIGTLRSWVDSWSSRDPNRYLAHYSRQFVPGNDLSLAEWVQQVRLDLEQSGFIRVFLENIHITRSSEDVVLVRFQQQYQSDRQNLNSRKMLTLRNHDGLWLIIKEVILDS